MNQTSQILLVRVAITMMRVALLYKRHTGFRSIYRDASPVIAEAREGSILELDGMPIRGDLNAKVVLLEFSDYECPFCARHAIGVGGQLNKQYVAAGKLRHAFANSPLTIHHRALMLATAAIGAGQQDQDWQMRDALFNAKPTTKVQIVGLLPNLSALVL